MNPFQTVALVKEIESPENPGGRDKRVALIPQDVGVLVKNGVKVFVEHGAGEGVGFPDSEYALAGATMAHANEIYKNKDLIVKFKGPSLDSIREMRPGTTLFCMAHFHSYPERAKLLEECNINVIAMEEVLESPKTETDEQIVSRMAMNAALGPFYADNSIGSASIRIISWSERLAGCIRRGSNRSPRSLKVIQPDMMFEDLDATGKTALYVFDGTIFHDPDHILPRLKETGAHLFDLAAFEAKEGDASVAKYRASHSPYEFGLRRIQCLHETGMAGARYGVKLLKENKPGLDIRNAKAVVLGYGNVGQGAIHELYANGIRDLHILGRAHTAKGLIDYWLKDADIIVNGAEQPPNLRGVNYLITNTHLRNVIPDDSVIIDLVGGSPTNRSAVEAVLSCTFLTDPAFVKENVTISALWGWPMMGMMRETAIKYSGQIKEILLGREKVIEGLDNLKPGVQRALVCGSFENSY